jgi:hypothetical protein
MAFKNNLKFDRLSLDKYFGSDTVLITANIRGLKLVGASASH